MKKQITFTCYGTWLHGGKEMSVDHKHNLPGTEFVSFNLSRQTSAKNRMSESLYLLELAQRQIVLQAIEAVCRHRGWDLLAVHVRTNHIHLVVHAAVSPEKILNTIKSYVSRRLNEARLDGDRENRWTRHGSTQYLWRVEEVETTIQYVVYEQGEPMAVFENRDRLCSY